MNLAPFVHRPVNPLSTRRAWCVVAISLLLVLGCVAPARAQQTPAPSTPTASTKEKPVAVVGSEMLYEKDYLPSISADLQKLRSQEYDLRLRALEEAVNRRLLKTEAAKKGVSEQEWLKTEIDSRVEPPTGEEVDQEFVQEMFANGGGQAPPSRDEIADNLKKQFVMEARDQYFQGLRKRSGVKILLLPQTVEVSWDPKRVRGNPNAPITIVEFSDFHCPYCEKSYSTLKDLLKKYDGKVKMAYRDLPLLEPGSKQPSSAEAARCAGDQGKFWEFHDLLFENQDALGLQSLQGFATELKLDVAAFTNCLQSGKFKEPVHADLLEAQRLGITGTPGFYINGVYLNGAHPAEDFEDIIDTELALMAMK